MGLELFVDSALEAISLLDNLTKLAFQKPNFLFTALNQLVRLSFIVSASLIDVFCSHSCWRSSFALDSSRSFSVWSVRAASELEILSWESSAAFVST
jgi:hypothetical protein